MDEGGTTGAPPTNDGRHQGPKRAPYARPLGAGVASRSGTPGTPASTRWWERLLLGYGRPPYPGIAEADAGDRWTGYLKEPPPAPEERLGISCSGGGIRAASFVLGALQSLRDAAVLDGAAHIAAVSGGGYLATGYAALVGLTRQEDPDPKHRDADALLKKAL